MLMKRKNVTIVETDEPTPPVAQQSSEIAWQAVIDILPINVLLCDPNDDFKVVYANSASEITLKSIESILPCKADEIGRAHV